MADLVQWADQFGCFCTEVVSADKHRPQLLSPFLEVGHVWHAAGIASSGLVMLRCFSLPIFYTRTLEHEINSEKQRIHYQASQQDVVTVVPLDCISTQLYQPRHTYTYTACCKLYIYIYNCNPSLTCAIKTFHSSPQALLLNRQRWKTQTGTGRPRYIWTKSKYR